MATTADSGNATAIASRCAGGGANRNQPATTGCRIASASNALVAPTTIQKAGLGVRSARHSEPPERCSRIRPRLPTTTEVNAKADTSGCGAPVRAAIGGGADIIPGTKKVAGPGASITMPIGNKDDRWVFDDMDAAEIAIADAPREDEILIALVLSTGGRPHARVKKPGA